MKTRQSEEKKQNFSHGFVDLNWLIFLSRYMGLAIPKYLGFRISFLEKLVFSS